MFEYEEGFPLTQENQFIPLPTFLSEAGTLAFKNRKAKESAALGTLDTVALKSVDFSELKVFLFFKKKGDFLLGKSLTLMGSCNVLS